MHTPAAARASHLREWRVTGAAPRRDRPTLSVRRAGPARRERCARRGRRYWRDYRPLSSCHAGLLEKDRKSTRLTPVTNAPLVCSLLLEHTNNITHDVYTP